MPWPPFSNILTASSSMSAYGWNCVDGRHDDRVPACLLGARGCGDPFRVLLAGSIDVREVVDRSVRRGGEQLAPPATDGSTTATHQPT